MSIETITEKIRKAAGEEAEALIAKAQADRDDILGKASKQADAIRKEMEKKATQDGVLFKERKISVAELEARKLELSTKQTAITRSFALALERLSSMDQNAYVELLVKAVIEAGVKDGELLFNQKDRASIGQRVVDEVNGKDETVKVSLSEDAIDAKGGFVLRKGSMEINATLETMVNAVKEAVTPEVVEALF
jgi:V/A-type H+-transporting ATPase subunit E